MCDYIQIILHFFFFFKTIQRLLSNALVYVSTRFVVIDSIPLDAGILYSLFRPSKRTKLLSLLQYLYGLSGFTVKIREVVVLLIRAHCRRIARRLGARVVSNPGLGPRVSITLERHAGTRYYDVVTQDDILASSTRPPCTLHPLCRRPRLAKTFRAI